MHAFQGIGEQLYPYLVEALTDMSLPSLSAISTAFDPRPWVRQYSISSSSHLRTSISKFPFAHRPV